MIQKIQRLKITSAEFKRFTKSVFDERIQEVTKNLVTKCNITTAIDLG